MRSISHKGITWHDDPCPTEELLSDLQKRYGFHELDIEDCVSEHERPKIEEYDDYIFIVVHIPYRTLDSSRILKEEINIFLGADFLITLHNGKLSVFDELQEKLAVSEEERTDYMKQGTGYFLYELMNHFFDDIFPLVDDIRREIRRMEEVLFETEEGVDLLKDIMSVKRNIISLRSILSPQRTLIAMLEHKNKKFVPEKLALYFDDILDAIERQWALLDTAKEMIDALQETHESWLSHRTNAVIKVLTLFSVTMLPLTFITGLYGMNLTLPVADHPQAFFIVLGSMGILISAMLIFFARKNWL